MKWIVFGLIFWFAETAGFGFNWEPSCRAERICDGVAIGLVWYGIIQVIVIQEIRKIINSQ